MSGAFLLRPKLTQVSPLNSYQCKSEKPHPDNVGICADMFWKLKNFGLLIYCRIIAVIFNARMSRVKGIALPNKYFLDLGLFLHRSNLPDQPNRRIRDPFVRWCGRTPQ